MQIGGISQNTGASGATPQNQKSISQLSEGEKFKATILDIKPNQVTIRLGDGTQLTAKALVTPDARISQEMTFSVKENMQGQVLLEMVKATSDQTRLGVIKESLQAAGMYPSEENKELVKALMDNGLPIDKNTLEKAAFFKYAKENMTLDKVLFLLKEDFKTTEKSIDSLNHFLEKTADVKNNMNTIFNETLKLPAGAVKNKMLELLTGDQKMGAFVELLNTKEPAEALALLKDKDTPFHDLKKKIGEEFLKTGDMKKALVNSVLLELKDKDSLKEINHFFKQLNNSMAEATKVSSDVPMLNKAVHDMKDNIAFMNQIDNYKQLMQIPFTVQGQQNESDIYVLKGKKGSKNLNENASVLLALDLVNLGHIEAFIVKNKKEITCQFRVEDENIQKLIKINAEKLNHLLQQNGYVLQSVSYKNIHEPFTVVDDLSENKEDAKNKRYTFDMRV